MIEHYPLDDYPASHQRAECRVRQHALDRISRRRDGSSDVDRSKSSPRPSHRLGRISDSGHLTAKEGLGSIEVQVDHVEVTASLVNRAGELSEELSLREYDAVHLAAGEAVADDDLVFVTGDQDQRTAAIQLGFGVANLE